MNERLFERNILRRIAWAIVLAEVRRVRGTSSRPLSIRNWSDETSIGEEGLGLDSLEQLGALGALAETFLLDNEALPEASPKCLGDWIDWIERSRRDGQSALVVKTSGSTGAPKTCTHNIKDLWDEADYLVLQLSQCQRLVSLVPASHLYGIVWTAFLPAALGITVVDRTLGRPLGLMPGDMLVAVPQQWEAIRRLNIAVPPRCVAVSSAGTMSDDLGADLLNCGFCRILDVYGSSETGAIAMRDLPSAGYELLPRWELSSDEGDWWIVDRGGARVQLPDHVEWLGERLIRPIRRRDGAMKIAGHNVWPEKVEAVLLEIDGVAAVAVRMGENGRLKAFVVAEAEFDLAVLHDVLELVARERLEAAERPKEFRFGPALPRNDMGKLADWA